MIKMKVAKMKGAYGIGMSIPIMERISNVTTIEIANRRKRNFLSLIGSFIVVFFLAEWFYVEGNDVLYFITLKF